MVCNHPDRKDIEAQYRAFNTLAKIGQDFDLTLHSIWRHAQFFGLDERRAGETEKALRGVIARGFQQLKTVDASTLMVAIRELNKLGGRGYPRL
jgi:hypothetical protein